MSLHRDTFPLTSRLWGFRYSATSSSSLSINHTRIYNWSTWVSLALAILVTAGIAVGYAMCGVEWVSAWIFAVITHMSAYSVLIVACDDAIGWLSGVVTRALEWAQVWIVDRVRDSRMRGVLSSALWHTYGDTSGDIVKECARIGRMILANKVLRFAWLDAEISARIDTVRASIAALPQRQVSYDTWDMPEWAS